MWWLYIAYQNMWWKACSFFNSLFFPLMMKIVIVVEELGGMDDFKTCVQSIYLLIVLGILTSFTQKLHWQKSVRWYVNLQVNVNRNISGGLWFKIHQIGRDGSFWLLPILAQGVSIFKWCMWVWIWLAVLGSNSFFFWGGDTCHRKQQAVRSHPKIIYM